MDSPGDKMEIQIETIKKLLTATIDIDDCVAQLTAPFSGFSSNAVSVEGPLWVLWASVNEVVQETPPDSPDLDTIVTLLAAIKALPPLTDGAEECVTWGGRVWDDLPMFGPNMRETWNPPTSTEESVLSKERQRWCSLNSFTARITASRLLRFNFDLYAIWQFRSALESNDIETLDTEVPAAAQWIFHAGHLIYNLDREFEHGHTKGDPARGGPLWDGKRGFCVERWNLWKSQFAWVSTVAEVDEGTRLVAAQARDAMEAIEKDPQTEIWRAEAIQHGT